MVIAITIDAITAVIMTIIEGFTIITSRAGFIIIHQRSFGCLILCVAGKVTTSRRAILALRITTHIIKIEAKLSTKIPHSTLLGTLAATSWGQMEIGAVGTTIGVTQMHGHYVGDLMVMTHSAGGYAAIVGIQTRTSGLNGVVGSRFM